MAHLRKSVHETRAGSAIAVLEGGDGPHCVFAIGGIAVRPFAECGLGAVLEDAAGRGARCVVIDIAGSGESTARPGFTMDTWLADIEEVFDARVREPALWTGASVGAWLMLLAHRRDPRRFRAMCALAPAIDWDQAYIGPALRDGKLGVIDGTVVNPDATAVATRELLVSMAPHHLMRGPMRLDAPLHVIFGARDTLAPAGVTRHFIESAHGARCSGEMIPDGDHGVAKLDPPLALVRYQHWLRAHMSQTPQSSPATTSPAVPGTGR